MAKSLRLEIKKFDSFVHSVLIVHRIERFLPCVLLDRWPVAIGCGVDNNWPMPKRDVFLFSSGAEYCREYTFSRSEYTDFVLYYVLKRLVLI
jgi:hypothetical protein